MATVYLAHHVRHDRNVAIKVLKPEVAAVLGAERFVQEIKTTAARSHPHIRPLFDSGEAAGVLYYVMPCIKGETVREKLNRETQLGIEQAVRITTEVADALDDAHRHGVIHRDIKPENVLLHDGRAMVMDFGIALAVSASACRWMTETGLSLGMPHYMSPEQATAEKDLTNRSDVHSLGSVLHEMLTGNPSHTGATVQQIIMRIVTEEAQSVTVLRRHVPPNVAAAVAKSLEKVVADRCATVAEFRAALTNVAFRTAQTDAPSGSRPLRRLAREPVVLGLIGRAIASLVARAVIATRGTPAQDARTARCTVASKGETGGVSLQSSQGADLAISRGGNRSACLGTAGSRAQILMREGDQLDPVPIRGTKVDWRASLGLSVGGLPAVLIAAYIVGSLPLTAVRWLVIVVVLYTAATMLRSGLASRATAPPLAVEGPTP